VTTNAGAARCTSQARSARVPGEENNEEGEMTEDISTTRAAEEKHKRREERTK